MKRLICLAMAACSCISTGCAYADPETILYGNVWGWGFKDSKDNDVSFDKAEYDPATGTFVVENFSIKNNASGVRLANVQQMDAHERQMRTMTDGLANIAAQMPTPPGWVPPLRINAQPTE